MKGVSSDANVAVEDYFAAVPAARQRRIRDLHELILSLYPHARVDLQYRMPTYHVDAGWVALANQKNYVSLYTCGYHHISEFKARHPGIKTGKGCINLRDRDPLPLEDLRAVVRHAIEKPKG